MFALFLATSLSAPLAGPVQVQRDYVPNMVDPGLHADLQGSESFNASSGDLTPDGRVAVMYRYAYNSATAAFAPALVAVSVDPANIGVDTTSRRLNLFDPDGTTTVGGETLGGSDFALGSLDDQFVIEFSPTPMPNLCPLVPVPLPQDFFPRSTVSGASNLTMYPEELPSSGPEYGQNPYPSNSSGVYDENAGYRTYRMKAIFVDFRWECVNNEVKNGVPVLGERDLTIIVEETVPETIESVTATPFVPLKLVDALGGTDEIRGIEPSISIDGHLLLYNGASGTNAQNASEITYVFREDLADDWEAPASVADLHLEASRLIAWGDATVPFGDIYRLAQNQLFDNQGNPIDPTTVDPDSIFRGAYPWVSRDGSFFVASRTEAADDVISGSTQSGIIACGNVTNWYVKHVDDSALNPTRAAARITWPRQRNDTPFTKRQLTMSTGLKPGLWEPLMGSGAPLPATESTYRVPVLPLFSFQSNSYGEIRFEEADGDYALYLACNEGIRPAAGDNKYEVDPNATVDTSGNRCGVTMHGARFGPEYYESVGIAGVGLGREYVRQQTGIAFDNQGEYHENLGIKGQALMFSQGDSLKVTGCEDLGAKITLQAFVKLVDLPDPGEAFQIVLNQNKRIRLAVRDDGSIRAVFKVKLFPWSTPLLVRSLTSGSVLTDDQDPFETEEGWYHIAATYDGEYDGKTRLELFVDGVLVAEQEWQDETTFGGSPLNIRIGPWTSSGGGGDVDLLLDEVAISDVVRTPAELRRDAYIAQPQTFQQAPPEISLMGLDLDDTRWPVGQAYDQAKVNLGKLLFEGDVMSTGAVSPPAATCTGCHDPTQAFANGAGSSPSGLDTPTSFNTLFGTHKLFDGSAATLEDQVLDAIESEFGTTRAAVLNELQTSGYWQTGFQAIYGPGPSGNATEARLAEVLAMYLRTEVSGASIDNSVLSEPELRGKGLFFGKARCFDCHRGSNFSDDDFRNTGSAVGFAGRQAFTGRLSDEGFLKTPTLWNVIETGDYFHDGSEADLTDVVEFYNAGVTSVPGGGTQDRQLRPLGLTSNEVADLVAFLMALDG